jgi:hypothetical protein
LINRFVTYIRKLYFNAKMKILSIERAKFLLACASKGFGFCR